jgi:hypothetical protein
LSQVAILLSTYILKHKNRLFDPRNIKLALVKGDLLGEAFGVSAFHRCQVNNFLRDQLIPYNPATTWAGPDLNTYSDISSSDWVVVTNTLNEVDTEIIGMFENIII